MQYLFMVLLLVSVDVMSKPPLEKMTIAMANYKGPIVELDQQFEKLSVYMLEQHNILVDVMFLPWARVGYSFERGIVDIMLVNPKNKPLDDSTSILKSSTPFFTYSTLQYYLSDTKDIGAGTVTAIRRGSSSVTEVCQRHHCIFADREEQLFSLLLKGRASSVYSPGVLHRDKTAYFEENNIKHNVVFQDAAYFYVKSNAKPLLEKLELFLATVPVPNIQ